MKVKSGLMLGSGIKSVMKMRKEEKGEKRELQYRWSLEWNED